MPRVSSISVAALVALELVACRDSTRPASIGSVRIVPPNSTTLVVGRTLALVAIVTDASGRLLLNRTVTWTTSDGSVLTVASTGVTFARATGIAPGTVTITASAGGKSGTLQLAVVPPPIASVTITPPASSTLFVGDTVPLSAVVKDDLGNVLADRAVTWSSSDPAIATVQSTGPQSAIVIGRSPGAVTVSASAGGKSGTLALTVRPAPVATVAIVPPPVIYLHVGFTLTLTAVVKDARGNVLTDRTVTWTSSNPSIASVQSTGPASALVKALSPGTVTISSSAEGKSGTFVLIVPQ